MISQSSHFAEVFNHVRDNARPASEAELVHLVSAHEEMKPSKSHIKRLTRDRSRPFVDPAVPSKPVSERTLTTRMQLEEHKKALAALGGEFRWVKPSDDVLYNARERELYTVVAHPNNSEQTATSFMEAMAEEQRKIDAMRERMRARAMQERRIVKEALLSHAIAKAAPVLAAALGDE